MTKNRMGIRPAGRAASVGAIAAAALLALSGCAGEGDVEATSAPVASESSTAAATPTSTAAFASDEEALAAGVAALQAAVDLEISAYGRPETTPATFESVAVDQHLLDMQGGSGEASAAGYTFSGAYGVEPVSLQRATGDSVTFYVCLDTSGVQRWDAAGAAVPRQESKHRFLVVSEVKATDAGNRVASLDLWSDDPC